MRIAFIYKYFPSLGGAERVMTVLANEFVEKGVEIVIYSFQQELDQPAYLLDKAISILPLPDKRKIASSMNVDYLSNDLIKNEISILLNHDTISDSMLLCKKVKEKTGIPLITLHHGQIYLPYSSLFSIVCIKQGFNIRKALFPLYYLYVLVRECLHHKKNIRICDAYVVLSSSFQRQLGSSSKIQAIGNPLSYSSFFDMSQYDKKENVVVMVGRISEFHKRFSLALKIWQKIETNPAFSSWNFEIVGDGSV